MTPQDRFWQFQGDLVKPGSDLMVCFKRQIEGAEREALAHLAATDAELTISGAVTKAVAEERERCAKIAEDPMICGTHDGYPRIARAIREGK